MKKSSNDGGASVPPVWFKPIAPPLKEETDWQDACATTADEKF